MKLSKTRAAVILIGHGSRQRGFQSAMKRVAARLKKDKRFSDVSCAYLEIARPSIAEAVERSVRRGASEIRLLPYFVLSGRHVASHIPSIVSQMKKKHTRQAKITLCPYLGYDEALVTLAKKRIGQAA